MVEQYLIWVLLVGIALGAAGAWFVIGRLPRRSEDIGPAERAAEAEYISQTIKQRGGVAPVPLVEEVLELHLEYLAGEPLELAPAEEAEMEPGLEPAAAEPAVVESAAVEPSTRRADAPPAETRHRPAGEPRGR